MRQMLLNVILVVLAILGYTITGGTFLFMAWECYVTEDGECLIVSMMFAIMTALIAVGVWMEMHDRITMKRCSND